MRAKTTRKLSDRCSCLVLMLAAWLGVAPLALAQSGEPHFKDKQIRLLIGSSAGGGYDTFARTIAAYWGKHIPGNPTFIPQNSTACYRCRSPTTCSRARPRTAR